MNNLQLGSAFLFTLLACSACSDSPRLEEAKQRTTHAIERFNESASQAGNDIKSSINDFGKNSGSSSGSSNKTLKSDLHDAADTIGRDVEESGHAIAQKINSLGNDMRSVYSSKSAGPGLEQTLQGFGKNLDHAVQPVANSVSHFGNSTDKERR